MSPVAYLHGTEREPEVWLRFDRSAMHPNPANGVPITLTDWVKKAPSRYWNSDAGYWVIRAFGPNKNPDAMLWRAGFEVHIDESPPGYIRDESLANVLTLSDLVQPMVRASVVKPTTALVRMRFTGWEGTRDLLGPGARWDKETGRFEVPLTDLLVHGVPKRGLIIDPKTIEAAQALLTQEETFGHAVYSDETISADLSRAAASTGLDLTGADQEAVARLADVVGEIPDWFGMTPFPYQRLGAMAVAAGRGLLCDPTGLGKSLQIIAAFALRNVQRGIIIVPPVVVTHWGREIERCGLAAVPPKPPTKTELKRREREAKKAAKQAAALAARQGLQAHAGVGASGSDIEPPAPTSQALEGAVDPSAPPNKTGPTVPSGTSVTDHPENAATTAPNPRELVIFRAGRKEKPLPETGIIVVPDSLLASRPELVERIAQWRPDALAYDEAHRARKWTSRRSEVVRGLVERMQPGALRIAATATPLFSSPAELAPLLAITGHLDRVFGGYEAYMRTYCKRNFFNAWVPRLEMLPQLRAILADKVWVRRVKTEVLRDLPPKRRTGMILDVDLSGFRAAHAEVVDKILVWVDSFVAQFGEYPDDDAIEAWSRQQIGLMSPLRKAAGVAKVPVALDMIAEWIDDEALINADGTASCVRPLLVWAHHHEVIDALRQAAPAHLKDRSLPLVKVIDGSTSAMERGRLADEFQAGRIPVLVASITAAGVGLTLTKSSDAWFLESDWDVPVVTQAEDRIYRIGQENHVTCTTLLAEGTLDARIQEVLERKAKVIEQVVGASQETDLELTDAELDAQAAPAEIIASLVYVAIEKHQREHATKAA